MRSAQQQQGPCAAVPAPPRAALPRHASAQGVREVER